MKKQIEEVVLSTTDVLQGYSVVEYIDVATKVFVILEDGRRVREKDSDLWKRPEWTEEEYAAALLKWKLKRYAYEKGGNAMIGIQFTDFTYRNVETGQPNVITYARGTVVKVKKQ